MVFRASVLAIRPGSWAGRVVKTASRKKQIRKGLILWRLQMILAFLSLRVWLAKLPPRSVMLFIVRCRTTKSMSERERSRGLAKRSEVEFQTELNVTAGSGG